MKNKIIDGVTGLLVIIAVVLIGGAETGRISFELSSIIALASVVVALLLQNYKSRK